MCLLSFVTPDTETPRRKRGRHDVAESSMVCAAPTVSSTTMCMCVYMCVARPYARERCQGGDSGGVEEVAVR